MLIFICSNLYFQFDSRLFLHTADIYAHTYTPYLASSCYIYFYPHPLFLSHFRIYSIYAVSVCPFVAVFCAPINSTNSISSQLFYIHFIFSFSVRFSMTPNVNPMSHFSSIYEWRTSYTYILHPPRWSWFTEWEGYDHKFPNYIRTTEYHKEVEFISHLFGREEARLPAQSTPKLFAQCQMNYSGRVLFAARRNETINVVAWKCRWKSIYMFVYLYYEN